MPLLYIVITALLTRQPSMSKYDNHNKQNKFKTFIGFKCYHFPLLSVTYHVKCDLFEVYFKQDN